MIFQLLSMLLISLGFGNKTIAPKHDLRKPETKQSPIDVLNTYFTRYFGIIAVTVIIIALIVFVWVCFTFVGASAVESGNVYYHMQDVI